MAHFAQVVDDIVVKVLVVPDSEEHRGDEYLNDLGLSGEWVQTSYNTVGGEHLFGGVPLRKNFAGVGFTYDRGRDAFVPPQPEPDWILDEETCLWGRP